MRDRFLGLLACAVTALAACASHAEDGVLYWMIDSSAEVSTAGSGSSVGIEDFFNGLGEMPDGSWYAARVRVTGGDSADTFLDLYYPSGLDDGEWGVEFDDDFTVGTPYGAKVSVPEGFASGSPEYRFVVEIGNATDSTWTTVAQSSSMTYSGLVAEKYIHPLGELGVPSPTVIWTPTSFTAVPEPSCGFLMSMGLALLVLRRKRFEKGT